MKQSLFNSFLLHLVVLLFFIFSLDSKDQKNKGDGESEEPNKTKTTEVDIVEVDKDFPGNDKCEEKYIGIGISWEPKSGTIMRAPQGYPAYIAGIREGDVLMNVIRTDLKLGETVFVVVKRQEDSLSFQIQTGEICINKSDN